MHNPLKHTIQIVYMNELPRQLVHMSGLAFILFAQLTGGFAAWPIALLTACFFFLYGEYVLTCEKHEHHLLARLECRLRAFALSLERSESRRPFAGAFWFYLGMGLAFLIFPLPTASAAGASLAVSDSLSTIIGKNLGRHKLLGRKTLEGTLAFLISAFLVCLLFVSPQASFAGAVTATLAELLPGTKWASSNLRGLLDDNLLIPLAGGLVIVLLA
jgi:dolichol kinase